MVKKLITFFIYDKTFLEKDWSYNFFRKANSVDLLLFYKSIHF